MLCQGYVLRFCSTRVTSSALPGLHLKISQVHVNSLKCCVWAHIRTDGTMLPEGDPFQEQEGLQAKRAWYHM
eukprot:scaffold317175_cov23-Tisochrysis_lutea.AAC.1